MPNTQATGRISVIPAARKSSPTRLGTRRSIKMADMYSGNAEPDNNELSENTAAHRGNAAKVMNTISQLENGYIKEPYVT